MKKHFTRIATLLMTIALVLGFVSCINAPQRQQKIMEMFDSFPKSDQYILATKDKILVGKTEIDLNNIKYNGERCHLIAAERMGAYAYFRSGQTENSVGIVYISYAPVEVQLLTTVENLSSIHATEYCENKLYFRVSDPPKQPESTLFYLRYFVRGIRVC